MLKTSILGKILRFRRDNRGVSAVEFALVAPVLIATYFSVAEIAQAVTADRKVSLVAATLANLTAQVATISTSDMTNILDASSAIAAPFSSASLKMTVTCISIDANKVARVKWSATRGGSANSGTITIPTALAVASSTLILAEASYGFTPVVGYTISGTVTLSDKMYMSPRISAPTYGTTACT
jgi:Flp pilus assembly protein TadG